MNLGDRLKTNFNFTNEELEITLASYVPETLAAKNYFLKKDQVSDKIAFIISGMLRSFFYNDNADDITTHFFLPETVVISMISFNKRVPSHEYIVALEDCELLTISYDKMMELIEKVHIIYGNLTF